MDQAHRRQIQQEMGKRALSQRQLAKTIGVSNVALANAMRSRSPSGGRWRGNQKINERIIAEHLGITLVKNESEVGDVSSRMYHKWISEIKSQWRTRHGESVDLPPSLSFHDLTAESHRLGVPVPEGMEVVHNKLNPQINFNSLDPTAVTLSPGSMALANHLVTMVKVLDRYKELCKPSTAEAGEFNTMIPAFTAWLRDMGYLKSTQERDKMRDRLLIQ